MNRNVKFRPVKTLQWIELVDNGSENGDDKRKGISGGKTKHNQWQNSYRICMLYFKLSKTGFSHEVKLCCRGIGRKLWHWHNVSCFAIFQPTKLPESCHRSSHAQANGNAPEGVGGKEQHNSFYSYNSQMKFSTNACVGSFLFFLHCYLQWPLPDLSLLTLAHNLFCFSLTAHLVHLKANLSLYL